LSVARDGGRATSEQVIVHRGDNVLTLAYVARTRGWHSFRVAGRATGDTVPQNDSLAATVDVGAPPTALVAAPDGNSVVARELAASGVAVATGPLPARPAAYRGYDLVVLDDVRRSSLTSGQVAALSTAVRFSGTGLFVTGGPRSLSLGGYAGSPLDALLPVTSRTPGQLQRRDLALELAVDRSGSMSDRAGGVPKIAMAQRAALAATDFAAAHRDELGVVDFDIRPHVGVPLGRVSPSNHKAVAKRIERITAAGGTDIYLGLQRALEQIARSHAPKRHLILLSDGISQPHDYTTLLARLRRAHVTVAAIALGSSADVDLLRSIADATGGNFYATANARALPRIFAREARLSSAPA
jgi:hypothetical protein